ncbi:MAG: DUF4105 domain-containing protein [Bacteroidaceae bacterium]|nr:DUF4105 domain-containing protein [Bacteroidaceae bacterium]
MRKFLFSFVLMLIPFYGWGTVSDSVRVSLLTCAPGSEIYSFFGNTALRYENPAKGEDWVFNYGMFSFNTPNFVMRFVKGETDYQLGVVPYRYFEGEYAMRGSSVYQQELNLTPQEKENIIRLLEENYRPANRTYRYNYFYDNCTTRARDKVEQGIEGKVVYPESEKVCSFRSIVREYTAGHEWSAFGIDLCLGSEADEPIDERKQMFSPFYMLEFAWGAMIHRADTIVPFVKAEKLLLDFSSKDEEVFEKDEGISWPSPWACALAWWTLTFVVMSLGIKRGKVYWLWDVLLFGAQGIGGCIIAFLFFFSVHPTVGSNWMLMMLNPLPLFYLPFMVYKAIKGKKDNFHWINTVVLTLFIILMPFIQQKFNPTVLPLALNLLTCSVGHLIIYNRQKK